MARVNDCLGINHEIYIFILKPDLTAVYFTKLLGYDGLSRVTKGKGIFYKKKYQNTFAMKFTAT